MRALILIPVGAVLLAGCGSASHKPAAKPATATVTSTATVTAVTPVGSTPGYLNRHTLEQAILAAYNRMPPLSAHASSASCVVIQATDRATCTMQTNRGAAVEPVAIAGDGSSYEAGVGQ